MKYYLLLTVVAIFFNDQALPRVNTDCNKKGVIVRSSKKASKKVLSYGGNFSNY